MTYPTYSQTTLEALPTVQLKAIAHSIGAIPDGDKRSKQTWIDAIISHQTAFSPVKCAAMEQHIETVMNRLESPADADETPTIDNYMPTPLEHDEKDTTIIHTLETPASDNYVPSPRAHDDDEAFAAGMGLSYDDVFGKPLGSSEWEETELETYTQSLELQVTQKSVSEPTAPSQQKGASTVALALVLVFGLAILIIKLGFTAFVWILAALAPLAVGLWGYLAHDTKPQTSIDYFPQV